VITFLKRCLAVDILASEDVKMFWLEYSRRFVAENEFCKCVRTFVASLSVADINLCLASRLN